MAETSERWGVFRVDDDWRIPAETWKPFGSRWEGDEAGARAEAERWNGAVFVYEARPLSVASPK